ncbi:MAG: exosortase system-associated protein, TIGR04073 family [Candidatus Omnitrophica bacterium]|nr:exosortase system-associated protein, TIGR04073 family [Candidatus Omnitrophota bacterium]
MGLLVLGLTLIGVQAGNGVVYEAPHYRTVEMPATQQVSWGAGMSGCGFQDNCCQPSCGMPANCGQPSCGQPSCGQMGCQYGPSPATKLTRGITNVITGPLEIPKNLFCGLSNCNIQPLDGLGVGIVRGTARAVERVGIGMWEVVTFPFPDFQPLLCPEFISLESCDANWRYGNYCEMPCGVCCNPCQGAASFMGVRNPGPPMQPNAPMQPMQPMEKPAPAFEKQLQSQAPPQTNAAMPGMSAKRGPVTYPDDYLK